MRRTDLELSLANRFQAKSKSSLDGVYAKIIHEILHFSQHSTSSNRTLHTLAEQGRDRCSTFQEDVQNDVHKDFRQDWPLDSNRAGGV